MPPHTPLPARIPRGFLRRLDGAVIDEVQRLPELLLAIKLAVDSADAWAVFCSPAPPM